MKTAEEILHDKNPFSVEVREFETEYVLTFEGSLDAMKEYGQQCAEQALKDAAETKQIDGVTPYFSPSEQLEITNTPILTP